MLYVNKDTFKKLVLDAETISKDYILELIERCTVFDDSHTTNEFSPEEAKLMDKLDEYFMTDHSPFVRQLGMMARKERLKKEQISTNPTIGKWFLNKRIDSLNFGRHYCSVCGQYPVSYDTCHTTVDITPAFCPHCGVRTVSSENTHGEFEEVYIST